MPAIKAISRSMRNVKKLVAETGKAEISLPANGWKPRDYQKPVWNYFEKGGKHAVVIWPRRHGKDDNFLNLMATQAFKRVGLYWMIYPQLVQGRRIAWDGLSKDGRRFRDAFPPELVVAENNGDMKLTLCNGSIFQVMGADHPDALRGANPVGIVFSEYPWMDPSITTITDPILTENGGWEAYVYTPFGNNHGLRIYEYAKAHSNEWFYDLKTAVDLKVLTPEELRKAREKAKSEEDFQQEFMCSFETPMPGAYYAKQLSMLERQNRMTKVPVDPTKPVHTAWDIGVGDATAIWMAQVVGREIRLVDYYERSGENLNHFLNYLIKYGHDNAIMWGEHYGPHDLSVKDWSSGKARIDVAREAGLYFKVCRKHLIPDGIEAVRNLLPMCIFDAEKCSRGIDCLRAYRSERDESKNVFNLTPVHDWSSNGSDAFRYLAYSLNMRGAKADSLGGMKGVSEKSKYYCNPNYDPREVKEENDYVPNSWRGDL